jgi:hypothetical protein
LQKFENSRIKIGNLLHNTRISDNNSISIKHNKKYDLIKALKIIIQQSENNSDLELIKLSSNIHPNTINKIVIIF